MDERIKFPKEIEEIEVQHERAKAKCEWLEKNPDTTMEKNIIREYLHTGVWPKWK